MDTEKEKEAQPETVKVLVALTERAGVSVGFLGLEDTETDAFHVADTEGEPAADADAEPLVDTEAELERERSDESDTESEVEEEDEAKAVAEAVKDVDLE